MIRRLVEYTTLILFLPALLQGQAKKDYSKPEAPVRTYHVKCVTEKQRQEVLAKAKITNILRAILDDDEKGIIDLEKYRELDEQLKILGYKKE